MPDGRGEASVQAERAISTSPRAHDKCRRIYPGSSPSESPYLKSSVMDLGLPNFVDHLIPLVEASLQTPLSNTFTSGTRTTGTINPGVIWVGNTFHVAVEALIPINRESGSNVGVIAQLHLYLDDIDPGGIGKPIFGPAIQSASPFPRN